MNDHLKNIANELDSAIAEFQLEEITTNKIYTLLMTAQAAVSVLNTLSAEKL